MNTATAAPSFRERRGGLLLASLAVLALAAAHWTTWIWLAGRYRDPGGLYGHGPLVPLVSGYLVWRDRRGLAAAAGPGSWAGLFLFLPALLLHLAGVALRVDFFSGVGLWLAVPGLVWLLGGAALLRRAAFPVLFLLFALPAPLVVLSEVAFWMKDWVIRAASTVLRLVDGGIRAEGSFLILPDGGGQLLVDDECCGLRSLVALVALGAFMACTARLGPGGRLFLFALAIPTALLANFLRVAFLCLVAGSAGLERARALHDVSGYAVYVVALLCYVGLDRILGLRWGRREAAS